MVKRSARKQRWSLGLIAFLFVAALLWSFVPPSSEWLERNYSRGLYPIIASVLVPITNAVPFSFTALLLVLVPLGWLVWSVVKLRGRRVLEWLWGSALLVLTIYLLFVVTWGANYGRTTIEAQVGLASAKASEDDLRRLVDTLEQTVRQNARAERDMAAARATLRASLIQTVRAFTGITPTLPAWPKLLPTGSLIRFGNASGVISPFTLEPHLDAALWETYSLAIGIHELAHIAGYAREADADFVAAVAGLRTEHPYARYAVALKLWSDAARQLPQTEYAKRLQALPQVARDDLESTLAPFLRYRLPAWIRGIQTQLYNRYLTSQGVSAGVGDYSRTTSLLIAAQRQRLLVFGPSN